MSRAESDAFGRCHPAVTFAFFAIAILLGAMILHPLYIAASLSLAMAYFCILHGGKGWRMVRTFLPLSLLMTLVNPLLNTRGERVLFLAFGRPYTFEALLYGMALSGMLFAMLLWVGCYSAVMTSDKFTSLFGGVIPTIAMLLTMVLRLVPNLIRKAAQISGARRCIGRGVTQGSPKSEQLGNGLNILSALMSWALEGGVTTANSMKSRGYGTAKRTAFSAVSVKARDVALFIAMGALAAAMLWNILSGGTAAEFTPRMSIQPLRGANTLGFLAYCAFLSLPTALDIKEAIQWRISRSRI